MEALPEWHVYIPKALCDLNTYKNLKGKQTVAATPSNPLLSNRNVSVYIGWAEEGMNIYFAADDLPFCN